MDEKKQKAIINLVGDSWFEKLKSWFQTEEATRLIQRIKRDRRSRNVYPEKGKVFNSLKLCPFENTKVVIIGQDPYHYLINKKPVADGLAFSSNVSDYVPPSLKVIYEELDKEYNHFPPLYCSRSSSLESWAKQGVLLLNTSLTVIQNSPDSHSNIGWSSFTNQILDSLKQKSSVCYMLWGKHARSLTPKITSSSAYILQAAHPVVHKYNEHLGVNTKYDSKKHFLGCNHFKECNNFLIGFNKTPIDWLN